MVHQFGHLLWVLKKCCHLSWVNSPALLKPILWLTQYEVLATVGALQQWPPAVSFLRREFISVKKGTLFYTQKLLVQLLGGFMLMKYMHTKKVSVKIGTLFLRLHLCTIVLIQLFGSLIQTKYLRTQKYLPKMAHFQSCPTSWQFHLLTKNHFLRV